MCAYLHLRPLERIMSVFPVPPGYSLFVDRTIQILTIEVGPVAIIVPPGASVHFLAQCPVAAESLS